MQRPCREPPSWFPVGCSQSSVDPRPSINMPACWLKSTARIRGWRSPSALWPTICSLMAGSSQGIRKYAASLASSKMSIKNYPQSYISYFSFQALDFLQQNSRGLQFMRTKPLPVSGAFHTELMESATEPLRDVLRQVEVSQTHRT